MLDASSYDRLEAAASTAQQRGVAFAIRAAWEQEQGNLDGARRLCQQAIDLADAAGDEATGVEARQKLAQILHFCSEFDGAVALMQQLQPWIAEHASDAEKVEFYGNLAIVLDNADRAREARTYHKRAIDLGRKIGAWSDVITVQGNLAVSWATAGYMARAIEVLHEALRLAAAHDDARGCGASLPIELHNDLRDSGRYADALRWAEPALAAADGQVAVWKPLVRCHFACGWIHLGQHARAKREIDAALATQVPEWIRAKALQMRARMRIALGQGARDLLAEALAAMPAGGRRSLRASILLDQALTFEPIEGLAIARDVIAESERLGTLGGALGGHIRAMRFAVDAGRPDDAVSHARAAEAIGDEVAPLRHLSRRAMAQRLARLAVYGARRGSASGLVARCAVGAPHPGRPGARGFPRQLRARQSREPATAARSGARGARRRRAVTSNPALQASIDASRLPAPNRRPPMKDIYSRDIDGHALSAQTLMMGYGYDPLLSEGAVKPPVFLTSTFVFPSAEAGARLLRPDRRAACPARPGAGLGRLWCTAASTTRTWRFSNEGSRIYDGGVACAAVFPAAWPRSRPPSWRCSLARRRRPFTACRCTAARKR